MFLGKNSKGSAIVTFLFFLPIILGMLVFSLYLGNRSKEQVRVSDLAQISSDALAAHSSQGLNMIAMNNQALAANLQVHNSALVLAYYGGIARTFTYDLGDAISDAKDSLQNFNNKFGEKIQSDVFDKLNEIGRLFINNAAGYTLYNQKLVDFWNYGALSTGVYTVGQNSPTSFAIPFQGDGAHASKKPYLNFGYEYLKTSSPHDTICTVSGAKWGSKGYVDLGQAVKIISKPLAKYTGGQSVIDKVGGMISKLEDFSPIQFSTTECGIALRGPIKTLFNLKKLIVGSNTSANIFTKGMPDVAANLTSSLYSIWNKHPDGVPTCSTRKTFAFGAIAVGAVNKFFSDNKTEAVLESYALKKSWDSGLKQIRYSTISPEACNENEFDSRCNQYFNLGPETHLCPLFYEPSRSGDRVVAGNMNDAFGGISKYCMKTEGPLYNPRIKEVNVFESVKGEMNSICASYKPWAKAADQNPDSGYRLTHIGTQMNYYLADNHYQNLKYVKTRDKNNRQVKKFTLGFTYIEKERYPFFLEHQSFKMGVAEPILNLNESLMMRGQPEKGIVGDCPLVIKGLTPIDGEVISKCRVNTGAILGYTMAPSVDTDRNSVDGIGRIMSGGTTDLGQESIFKRMQWGFAKSRVIYVQGSNDPDPPNFFKTMWPAWNNAPARASLTDFFGPESKLHNTALTFDKLLGKK